MPLGNPTITIMRSRITQLMHENGVLRRQVAILSAVNRDATPDYGLGGHEWVDPVSGTDTWNGAEGAD